MFVSQQLDSRNSLSALIFETALALRELVSCYGKRQCASGDSVFSVGEKESVCVCVFWKRCCILLLSDSTHA